MMDLLLPDAFGGLDWYNQELNGDAAGTLTALGTDFYKHVCVKKALEGTASGGDWTDPTNFTTSDQYASLYTETNAYSGFLKLSGMGFSLPSNATVRGIVLYFGGWVDNQSDGFPWMDFGFSKNGTDFAANSFQVGEPPTNNFSGGYRELHGTTWSYTDINSANFSLLVRVLAMDVTTGGITFYLNDPFVVVHYTTP
jgi:hypothetical protein